MEFIISISKILKISLYFDDFQLIFYYAYLYDYLNIVKILVDSKLINLNQHIIQNKLIYKYNIYLILII